MNCNQALHQTSPLIIRQPTHHLTTMTNASPLWPHFLITQTITTIETIHLHHFYSNKLIVYIGHLVRCLPPILGSSFFSFPSKCAALCKISGKLERNEENCRKRLSELKAGEFAQAKLVTRIK